MSGQKKPYKKQILIFTGILVFLLLALNNVLFLHAHQFKNGSVIYHAHPFQKENDSNPFKDHNHTLAEIIIIQSLQLFLLAAIIVVLVAIIRKFQYLVQFDSILDLSCFISNLYVRPPPDI